MFLVKIRPKIKDYANETLKKYLQIARYDEQNKYDWLIIKQLGDLLA